MQQQIRLPQIEIDKYLLDFNCIAEGCHDVRSFIVREILSQNFYASNYFILIEINDSSLKIKNNLNENDDDDDDLSFLFMISVKTVESFSFISLSFCCV